MNKWLKDVLPDKDPYHNRGRDQLRKKRGGPEFECLCVNLGILKLHCLSNVDNKMKNKKYHTVGRIPKTSSKMVERGKIDTLNTQTHDRSLPWYRHFN